MNMDEIGAMFGELGLNVIDTQLYSLIPGKKLPDGLFSLESQSDLDYLLDLVVCSHCQVLYATIRKVCNAPDLMNFSFTRFLEDKMVGRIENMREEVKHNDLEENNSQ